MTKVKIDIKDLTEEDRQDLIAQIKRETELRQQRKKRDREEYEGLKEMAIRESFELLRMASQGLLDVKTTVFDNFADVLDLKASVYELTPEQMQRQESHTFTTIDGKVSIIIGSNTVDRWDETVDVGVEKVREYLKKLSIDAKSARLVDMITDLLKPNKDGALKANRVLDLSKKAHEIGEKELIEAVDLIREAYRPAKTSTFIKAKMKDDKGNDIYLPLSMSSLP